MKALFFLFSLIHGEQYGMTVSTQFDLTGKVAIVTGGSRGIGKSIANCFATAGANVVIASRKKEGLDKAAKGIKKGGASVLTVATHTGDDEAVQSLASKTIDTFGAIDIVVNNAATNPHFGPLFGSDESHWDKIWEVNVKGYYKVANACLKTMKERGGGKIINMASILGKIPGSGMGIYSISKAAVIMLTKVMAQELAKDNIQVNAIAPGFVKTDFSRTLWQNEKLHDTIVRGIPQGRMADPDEIVGIALYLASSTSDYTTGETIFVDGGQSLGPAI
ncbi:MAG: glucose 1-dehydrogenase [Candidatus Marinimicrobia bacterium]|jgi:NAD(P)-dependent dehydrogenase (short-subunit alcohol dehydrogenase family)|nr:glucose 1-dehydrogenase [Candidatus Neomarinimicrobiota bacterium]|tara:strand:+ start:89 stop:919 length:831 start_codon:yes stop_codon:yes gene_type:complete